PDRGAVAVNTTHRFQTFATFRWPLVAHALTSDSITQPSFMCTRFFATSPDWRWRAGDKRCRLCLHDLPGYPARPHALPALFPRVGRETASDPHDVGRPMIRREASAAPKSRPDGMGFATRSALNHTGCRRLVAWRPCRGRDDTPRFRAIKGSA